MDSRICQKRINVNNDRLSSLPDDILYKILSSFDIKRVIETSVLSSRWQRIWTSMPDINFSSEGFTSLSVFSRFVTQVLSRRNTGTNVCSMNLCFHGRYSKVIVKRILKYAFFHNVQQMTVTNPQWYIVFPICFVSSHSLRNLTLSRCSIRHSTAPTSTWELPALTTLHLYDVSLSDDAKDKFSGLFSKCANLKTLTFNRCGINGKDGFSICHPKLSNLILENSWFCVGRLNVINVEAPQLKDLSLVFDYYYKYPQFVADRLEKVDLCIRNPGKVDASKIVWLLQQFHNVKFLTLNMEIIEALSSSVELISNLTSPFANLKSVRIHPVTIELGQAQKEVNVSTEVKSYLIDSSPSATFTMVSREETRDVRNTTLTQKHMAELRVLLDQEKEKTNRVHMDQQKAQMKIPKAKMHEQVKAQDENRGEQALMEMPIHHAEKMARIESCWEDLNVQIQLERERAQRVFSKLKDIENLLTELPASKRVKMEPCFSNLCAEADTVMNDAISRMKIHCDTKQRNLSVCFHELSEALKLSS